MGANQHPNRGLLIFGRAQTLLTTTPNRSLPSALASIDVDDVANSNSFVNLIRLVIMLFCLNPYIFESHDEGGGLDAFSSTGSFAAGSISG